MGWNFTDKDKLHRDFGPVIFHVNPGQNELFVADPDVLMAMLVKRKDFAKPDLYKLLDVYGPSVNTVNGDDWERHRKVTAPCFNERVSSRVWKEASSQAQVMLSQWLANDVGRTRSMVEDTRVVALHVLSAVGFGVSRSFSKGVRESKTVAGYTMNYRDALMTVLYNVPLVFIFSFNYNAMLLPFMPKSLQRVGRAVLEFRSYMEGMLNNERDLPSADKSPASPPNLMSTLIRSSDEARNGHKQKSSQFLSDKEIYGNLFAFNLAGHDTTANTMAFAISLLALEPKWQDWIHYEIRQVVADYPTTDYETYFPRLKRCLAIMVSKFHESFAMPLIHSLFVHRVLSVLLPDLHLPRHTPSFLSILTILMSVKSPTVRNSPPLPSRDVHATRCQPILHCLYSCIRKNNRNTYQHDNHT